MRDRDRFRGCIVGGAAGDALGYPVEFYLETEIFRYYGPGGVTRFPPDGAAEFSDDTQMTLFTANGLLLAQARGLPPVEGIRAAYADWYETQMRRAPGGGPHAAWLANVPGLYARRAPGNTCMSEIAAGSRGSTARPVNRSKGCGGVMRVAPVGLFYCGSAETPIEESDRIAAEAAALTHGHPLGWLSAAALAHIVRRLAEGEPSVRAAAAEAAEALGALYPETPETAAMRGLLYDALRLAEKEVAALDAVHALGEGWVGEEALAVAVYCAVKFENDPAAALTAAVTHGGDSDSTGAIAGNILGAKCGLAGLPAHLREGLELWDLLLEVADDLCAGGEAPAELRRRKYLDATYPA